MMKSLMSITLAAVMALSVVGSAKAFGSFNWNTPTSEIKVTNEWTHVNTSAIATVNTGSNTQVGGLWSSPKLTTGAVTNVGATAGSQVNMTFLPSCNCNLKGDVTVTNKATHVDTTAITGVNTGSNQQTSLFAKPVMTTGAVGTVVSEVTTTVNWTDFGVSTP